MRTYDEIVQIVIDLQKQQGPLVEQMRQILMRYDGEYVIPIPEMDTEPVLPSLTPALVGEAIDNAAMRAASVRPVVTCPAIDPKKDTGRRSRQYAVTRRRILAATYHDSKWLLGRRRFYRQLSAYHTGSLVVVPCAKKGMPQIEVRDPLATLVEPQAYENLRTPEYAAFITRLSGDALRQRFPSVRSENGGPVTPIATTELWDMVEWYDADQIMYGLVGPVHGTGPHLAPHRVTWQQIGPAMPNRAAMVPVVVPHNVSLGKIASRIGSLLGMVDLQAKMMALDIMAQEKAIFPDMYAIGRMAAQPQIVGGQWKDGRDGDINMLTDVEQIGIIRQTPDPRTSQMIDRMERNFRTSTGLLPQFGGETYGALRTGRGIDALAGIAVDPRIQELHEISEAYMPHLNEAIFRTYLGYFEDQKFTLISGWPGDPGLVEFTPSEHIETTSNTVAYAIAGADVVQQTQILGSLLGTGAMSRRTFRARHPWIDDPEAEGALVDEEQFEEALKQTILQQLSQGQLPLTVAISIRRHMAMGHDIFAAVEAAEDEARRIQASQPPPVPDGMAAPPESMPGLSAGPSAMQAPMPQQQVEVPGDVTRMRQLMNAMRGA